MFGNNFSKTYITQHTYIIEEKTHNNLDIRNAKYFDRDSNSNFFFNRDFKPKRLRTTVLDREKVIKIPPIIR